MNYASHVPSVVSPKIIRNTNHYFPDHKMGPPLISRNAFLPPEDQFPIQKVWKETVPVNNNPRLHGYSYAKIRFSSPESLYFLNLGNARPRNLSHGKEVP